MNLNTPLTKVWYDKVIKEDEQRNKGHIKKATKPEAMPKSHNDDKASKKTKENTKKAKGDHGLNKTLETFIKKRHDGAMKITENALEKGGAALLTYNHFRVKLPYYKKASKDGINVADLTREYKERIARLNEMSKDITKANQKAFQELVGRIEVIGELLIRNNKDD